MSKIEKFSFHNIIVQVVSELDSAMKETGFSIVGPVEIEMKCGDAFENATVKCTITNYITNGTR